MSVFKAISLINDLTWLVRKTTEERLIYEEVPNHSDHSELLCIEKHIKLFVSTVLYYFSGTKLCIDGFEAVAVILCFLRETEAGSFRGSPDREVIGSYLRNFWGFFHSLTTRRLVTGLSGVSSTPSYIEVMQMQQVLRAFNLEIFIYCGWSPHCDANVMSDALCHYQLLLP